jgi:hypothetical protein
LLQILKSGITGYRKVYKKIKNKIQLASWIPTGIEMFISEDKIDM